MKELQLILQKAYSYSNENIACVMATIVKIEGSGYRRQGTRMLISEDGTFTGAISGGCVEKEVWMQAGAVFKSQIPKLITYDGRYRLGCEGILYILIEPIKVTAELLDFFNAKYKSRTPLGLTTFYSTSDEHLDLTGTYYSVDNETIPLRQTNGFKSEELLESLERFSQILKPVKSLYIFGSEHDSVSLCKIASEVGWDVTIIAHPLNEKQISYFQGAIRLIHLLPEELDQLEFDNQTACILMSHSFSRDLAYLLQIVKYNIPYLGLLGPHKRKNQLLNQLMEHLPDIPDGSMDNMYGPVGLDIGAETPQEIAVSILAELQSVFTNTHVDNLRNKSGSIHERQD